MGNIKESKPMSEYQNESCEFTQEWLKERHPQNIYKCSICGRFHEIDEEKLSQTFITFIGTILDGIQSSNRPSLSAYSDEPVTIVICKRFRCVLEFAIGLLTLKSK